MLTIPRNFGRLEAPDVRDQQFLMRRQLDPLREQFFPRGLPAGSRHYRTGQILDQGRSGTCVAHGWTAKVHAAPIMRRMSLTPFDFYRRIVAADEFPSNDFEATAADDQLQSGTTVRAGAKALVALGYAASYLWAESAEDVRSWMLAGFGGVVIGIVWTSGMRETDGDGFITVTGASEGGHCVYLNGWNDKVKKGGTTVRAARGMNSWGTAWGQAGRFWMTEADLDAAIRNHGEACALTELRVPR